MELEMSQDGVDLPPEYCHYRDEACDLAGSCLNCPLPGCIYDQVGGKQRWLKRSRDGEIIRLAGSYKAYLEGIAAARNLPAAEMALGRKVAVIFFDEHNPKEAVVIAVYT